MLGVKNFFKSNKYYKCTHKSKNGITIKQPLAVIL